MSKKSDLSLSVADSKRKVTSSSPSSKSSRATIIDKASQTKHRVVVISDSSSNSASKTSTAVTKPSPATSKTSTTTVSTKPSPAASKTSTTTVSMKPSPAASKTSTGTVLTKPSPAASKTSTGTVSTKPSPATSKTNSVASVEKPSPAISKTNSAVKQSPAVSKTSSATLHSAESMVRSHGEKTAIRTEEAAAIPVEEVAEGEVKCEEDDEIVTAIEVCTCKLKVKPLCVVVTGAAGEIAVALLHLIASGEVFGKDRQVIITLFDQPGKKDTLDDLILDVLDCAFPLLYFVLATSDLENAYKAADAVVLMSAVSDDTSLQGNVRGFKEQGEALDKWARKTVRVLVVAHPANTNCLVCALSAPSIARQNFTAITRLDQNRARALLAGKIGVPVMAVNNIIIWGNHSSTEYPDASNATVNIGNKVKRLSAVVKDQDYLEDEFVKNVLNRGEAVGKKRKSPTSMAEARAICDHMYDWWHGTLPGKFVCMGVFSDGSYEVPEDVVCSFPVQIEKRKWTIVKGLPMAEVVKSKLDIIVKELLAERDEALDILKKDERQKNKNSSGI